MRVEPSWSEPVVELALEDQLVFEIMALLAKAPLEERQSILDTASAFVASEEAAWDDERKRQVVRLLASRGFSVEEE
jgi:SOS response regulatory protein OraA/RecX